MFVYVSTKITNRLEYLSLLALKNDNENAKERDVVLGLLKPLNVYFVNSHSTFILSIHIFYGRKQNIGQEETSFRTISYACKT